MFLCRSLTNRGDLTGRPILAISRGPVFVPCTDTPNPHIESYFKTDLASSNRVGFRYVPAGINPPGHATAFRTIESNPTCFRVSWEDRNANIKVTKDGLGLAGSGGYRSARCNAPMREGQWYLEVKILHGGGERIHSYGHSDENGGSGPVHVRREGSHVRLGWGRREASLNTPIGADGYSYGYCDKTGAKTTLGRLRAYGKSFGSGDVIGMYISLPPRRKPNSKDSSDPAHMRRERIPIDLKGQEVFEILEYPHNKEMTNLMELSAKSTQSSSVPSNSSKKNGPHAGKPPETTTNGSLTKPLQSLRPLPTLGPESKIAFFVNGECQGVAFQDLYDYLQLRQPKDKLQKAKEKKRAREGVKEHRQNPFDDGWLGYYPFISLFNDGAVRINPGPDFDYPPPPDIDALLEGRDPLVPLFPQNKSKVDPDVPNSPLNRMDGDGDVKATRTWRPVCERYAEFMQEQWDLDVIEEEEAKVEFTKWNEITKREEEKAEQRRQKRRETDAKRRAKKAAEAEARKREVMGLPPKENGSSVTSNQLGVSGMTSVFAPGYTSSGYPSPSPLRYSTAAYDLNREIEAAAFDLETNVAAAGERYATSEPPEPSRDDTPHEEDGMSLDQVETQDQKEAVEYGQTDVGVRIELTDCHSSAPTAILHAGHGESEYASDIQEEERDPEGVGDIHVAPEEEEEGATSMRKIRQRVEHVHQEEREGEGEGDH